MSDNREHQQVDWKVHGVKVIPGDQLISEPLYVDGHLLALSHMRDRAFVAVYDAARIPAGPVAKIWLDHHVPITFHGTFVGAR